MVVLSALTAHAFALATMAFRFGAVPADQHGAYNNLAITIH